MITAAVVAGRDDVVSVEVDITPLPSVLPTVPVGGATSPSGVAGHGWLAATGLEPAWVVVGAAVVLVALGIALLRTRRRRP